MTMIVTIIPQFTVTRLLVVSDEGGLPIIDVPTMLRIPMEGTSTLFGALGSREGPMNELQADRLRREFVVLTGRQFMSGRRVGPRNNTTCVHVLGEFRDNSEPTYEAFARADVILDMVEKQIHEGTR